MPTDFLDALSPGVRLSLDIAGDRMDLIVHTVAEFGPPSGEDVSCLKVLGGRLDGDLCDGIPPGEMISITLTIVKEEKADGA